MDKNDKLNYSNDFKILSGNAGSGSGVGYVPLRNGFYEFMVGNSLLITTGNMIATNTAGLFSVNDYVAFSFILNEEITINRLSLLVRGISTNLGASDSARVGIMQFNTTTGFPTQVSNVITFVTNAFQDVTTLTANSVNEFSFSTAVTLSANTWYCAGIQLRNVVNPVNISIGYISAGYGNAIRFPGASGRESGLAEGFFSSSFFASLGYNDGTTTNYYFGELFFASNTTINLFPTSTTNTQVGCKFQLNLPVDEIYIKSILLHQHQINTNHSIQCKIFTDSAGSNAIGSSVIIESSNLVSVAGNTRHRNYLFCPPVRIKPYKFYYAMWEITSGSATNTNPSRLNFITNTQNSGWNSKNIYCRRINSTDANFTEDTTASLPIRIMFDTAKETPRPQIGNM